MSQLTSPMAWTPQNIAWQELGADGTKYSLLHGRRNVPGETFVYAFFIPAGFWDPPHWHTATAYVSVLRGVLSLGYGDKHNDAALQHFAAGSFVMVPGNSQHFDGSHEDTLIIGTAVGPWSTHYVDVSVRPSAGTPE